jgi:hypothetical protein
LTGRHFLIAQSIDCVAAWDTIQDIKAQMDRVRYLSLHEVLPLDYDAVSRYLGNRKVVEASARDALRRIRRQVVAFTRRRHRPDPGAPLSAGNGRLLLDARGKTGK